MQDDEASRSASKNDKVNGEHLSQPPASTAGFTAVNGETDSGPVTSFRPATHDATMSTPDDKQAAKAATAGTTNGTGHQDNDSSSIPMANGDSTDRQRSRSLQREDGSPPAKRKRVSSSSFKAARKTPPTDEQPDSRITSDPYARPSRPSEAKSDKEVIDVDAQSSKTPEKSWQPQDVGESQQAAVQSSLSNHIEDRGRSTDNPDRESSAESDASVLESDRGAAQAVDFSLHHLPNGPQPKKREFSRRTKSGCHTCRVRKKKCDEARPHCKNCEKGAFVCTGYGAKPAGYTRAMTKGGQTTGRPTTNTHDTPATYTNGPMPQHDAWRGPNPPTPHEARPPQQMGQHPGYDPYHARPRETWPGPGHPDPSIHLQFNSLPRVDYSGIAPPHAYDRPHPLPPPGPEQWPPQYRNPPPPIESSLVHYGNTLAPMTSMTLTEREKMVMGIAVKPYTHPQLLQDALECTKAVEEYNKVSFTRDQYGQDALAECLTRVLDPLKRYRNSVQWSGARMRGSCGARTMIKAPLMIEYGYNLKIGEDVIIRQNCSFSDPCEISIGNGVIIGEGVRFCGWNANINPRSQSGSQGEHRGGAIVVEDNVRIGAGAIILAFRRIGAGAVVGAGSVVTKNVAPNTVVAGNPARVVRDLPKDGVQESRGRYLIEEENQTMLAQMQKAHHAREREMHTLL